MMATLEPRHDQSQYDYFRDDQWEQVASEPKRAIEAGLRLLYRLVLAVEDLHDHRGVQVDGTGRS